MSQVVRKNSLQTNTSDYVASAAKSALGAVPFVGSLLSELAGTLIPNQKIERLVKFAKVLDIKLSDLEENFVRSQTSNEYFTDLIEESLRQSARAITDERREYIANIVASSLSSQDIEYIEAKHLLRILDEINDIEVIWLKYYLEIRKGSRSEFRSKHQKVLSPLVSAYGSPQSELDKETLQTSYTEHLIRQSLIKPVYQIDPKSKSPLYDSFTGAQEIQSYEITPLGRLLLRQVGLEN